jgi:hypothetical protein
MVVCAFYRKAGKRSGSVIEAINDDAGSPVGGLRLLDLRCKLFKALVARYWQPLIGLTKRPRAVPDLS